MKKVVVFLVFLFSFLFLTRSSFAVDPYNERWTCLDVTRTMTDPSVPAVPQTEWPRYVRWVHSATLVTKQAKEDKPLANADTYIVECLQIPTNLTIPDAVKTEIEASNNGKIPSEVCTTGDSTVDQFIWNNDRYALAQKLYSGYDNPARTDYPKGFSFDGYYKDDLTTKILPQSTDHFVKTDANGDFQIGRFIYVSHSLTGYDSGRKFMTYNRFAKLGGDNLAGNAGGEQQGALAFDFETANKTCVKIGWDPYGTVFDAQTLEPIPNTSVALYVNKQGVFSLVDGTDVPGGFIQNPFTTKEDGYFSFVVPDGTYKLAVAASGYIFPSTQAILPGNASLIYSDFYKGENIVQKGKMVHRDIPIDPKTVSSSPKFPAKLIGLFQTAQPDGTTLIDGNVSHPFAKVRAFCKTTEGIKSTLNNSTQADKHGQFTLSFNPSKCDENKGESYAIVEVEAVDLTQSLSFNSLFDRVWAWILGKQEVHASLIPISYTFDPILNNVEGYAMDKNGTALPGATVGVYGIGDARPINEVKADAKGRFFIASNTLPQGPYALRYKNVLGITTSVTTSKFIAQNLPTIQKEKINLYAQKDTPTASYVPNSTPTITSTPISQGNNIRTPSDKSQTVSNQTTSDQMQNNAVKNQIIILVMLIVGITIVGSIIAVFMIKKQNTPTSF